MNRSSWETTVTNNWQSSNFHDTAFCFFIEIAWWPRVIVETMCSAIWSHWERRESKPAVHLLLGTCASEFGVRRNKKQFPVPSTNGPCLNEIARSCSIMISVDNAYDAATIGCNNKYFVQHRLTGSKEDCFGSYFELPRLDECVHIRLIAASLRCQSDSTPASSHWCTCCNRLTLRIVDTSYLVAQFAGITSSAKILK